MKTDAAVKIALAVLELAREVIATLPEIREAATTQDRARLDELRAKFTAEANAVADRLRATPDDPA